MWRRLFSEIVKWKDDPDRSVLLLEGVRQCGKTYLLKQLGREYFPDNTIYVNFEKDRNVHSLFDKDFDTKRIINDLSIYYNTEAAPGKTLIIFDEIQECSNAMTSLKYFTEDAKDYHVASAGSLLGLMINNGSFPVGKVKRMRLYPMTFLEFLRAEGEERLFEYLDSKDPSEPLSDTLHSMASDHLKNYYLIGGMPKAVDSWVRYRSIPKVTGILRSLLKDYRDDFVKHGSRIMDELTSIWDAIPSQLMKENRRMILKDVIPRGRKEIFTAPLLWLNNAGLIHCVFQAESPNVPLSEVKNASLFKVYPCDVGLLRVMSGTPPGFVLSNNDEYRFIKGAMAEGLVICSLMASGYVDDACYWKTDRNEVDFLISTAAGVVPMEVKYGKDSGGASMDNYCKKYHPSTSVHISSNNASHTGRMFVPLYSCETVLPYLNGNSRDHVDPVADPSLPYVHTISYEDWDVRDNGYSMTIRRDEHGRSSPSVIQVFRITPSGGYTMVNTGTEMSPDGDVIIFSSEMFEGKLSIL